MRLQDVQTSARRAAHAASARQGDRDKAAVFELLSQLAEALDSEVRDIKYSLRTIEDQVRNLG
ncbi:MAG: hypothetical protein EOP82_20835 [Variovorax sp.]|nr:MAG: hypothetical protein EOP82_20835 [Variovorax sp.]